MYDVLISPAAKADLDEIIRYIVLELENPIAAQTLSDKVDKRLSDLEEIAPDKTLSEKQQKERVLDVKGQLATAEKDWNRVFDCYFEIARMSESPKKPLVFPGKGFNAAVELMRAEKCAEARAMLERVRTLNLDYRSVLEAMDIEGRTYKVEKNFDAAWNLFKRTLEDKAFQEKGDLGGLVRKATATLKELKPAYAGVFAFVAVMSVRCPPAEKPMMPIRPGSSPRFGASCRTIRTARWASSHAVWCFAIPNGRGVRYMTTTAVIPFALR